MEQSFKQFVQTLSEISDTYDTHIGPTENGQKSASDDRVAWSDLELKSAFKAIGLSEAHIQELKDNPRFNKTAIVQHLINELSRTSLEDGLTGVYNRRYFERTMSAELDRSRREQRPCGLLLLDIDHFKQFNDQYGHDTGDLVLKCVASAIKSALRSSDTISRVGGEEFAIIVPNTFSLDTGYLAERVRQAIENLIIHNGDQDLKVTISIGVAINDPRKHIQLDDIYQQADKALYQAKSDGRNCVRVEVAESHKPSSAVTADERNELLG